MSSDTGTVPGGRSMSRTEVSRASTASSETTAGSSTTMPASTTTTLPPPTTDAATPAPTVYEGSGDTVVSVEKPDPGAPAVAQITNSGSCNFVVWSLDSNRERADLLINTIGSYEGVVAVDTDRDAARALEITSDGSWRVELHSASDARRVGAVADGTGDDVVTYVGDAGVATLSHSGVDNFVIWWFGSDGRELLVNEIGA